MSMQNCYQRFVLIPVTLLLMWCLFSSSSCGYPPSQRSLFFLVAAQICLVMLLKDLLQDLLQSSLRGHKFLNLFSSQKVFISLQLGTLMPSCLFKFLLRNLLCEPGFICKLVFLSCRFQNAFSVLSVYCFNYILT